MSAYGRMTRTFTWLRSAVWLVWVIEDQLRFQAYATNFSGWSVFCKLVPNNRISAPTKGNYAHFLHSTVSTRQNEVWKMWKHFIFHSTLQCFKNLSHLFFSVCQNSLINGSVEFWQLEKYNLHRVKTGILVLDCFSALYHATLQFVRTCTWKRSVTHQ